MNHKKWIGADIEKPRKDTVVFYGDRFSVPVVVADQHSWEVGASTARWDYYTDTWVDSFLGDAECSPYRECLIITHFQYLPEFKQE